MNTKTKQEKPSSTSTPIVVVQRRAHATDLVHVEFHLGREALPGIDGAVDNDLHLDVSRAEQIWEKASSVGAIRGRLGLLIGLPKIMWVSDLSNLDMRRCSLRPLLAS